MTGSSGAKRAGERGGMQGSTVVAALAGLLALGCGEGADQGAEAAGGDAEGGAAAREEAPLPYDFPEGQARAVRRLLGQGGEEWRLAVPDDNTSPLLIRMRRDQPGYEPYYLRADLTGNGEEDFAVALTDGSHFRVFWSRHAGGDSYAPAQPVVTLDWLDEGGLFHLDGDLVVGAFYSDRLSRYRWDPESRRLERVDLPPPGG